mmetsp:Transcript_26262/g.67785  ORF Transcript_26262/g.67785 Transcript_26262/m.67785 type:complete len:241 (-) Transcript_26262:360-1082(-)
MRSARTSCVRSKHSTVNISVKPASSSALHTFCTCSMHGLNEQSLPLGLRQIAAEGMTFGGAGKSRNTASALPAKLSSSSLPASLPSSLPAPPCCWISLPPSCTLPQPSPFPTSLSPPQVEPPSASLLVPSILNPSPSMPMVAQLPLPCSPSPVWPWPQGKPHPSTSLWRMVTQEASPFDRTSAAASLARSKWCSKEYTWPEGATARARECVRDPDPVPDSNTTAPGHSSRYMQTMEMSAM